jgi:hypothetical protein
MANIYYNFRVVNHTCNAKNSFYSARSVTRDELKKSIEETTYYMKLTVQKDIFVVRLVVTSAKKLPSTHTTHRFIFDHIS